jgi:Xaa-Pro aminopeptidase
VDIEASARKHGVTEADMVHALRHHWRSFGTDDPSVTMFIGPSAAAEPPEIGVVTDGDGTAVIHAMRARRKFLKGWWSP